MLGMRHQPHDIALGVDEAGDPGDRAVGALALVAEDDLARRLELGEQLRAGEETAFAVLDRDAQTLSLRAPRCEGCVRPLDRERHVAANKTERVVWPQGAWEEAGL